ncbi:gluconolaconase [Sandarakinorhabdus cyanobacteriorum]|uniref:Gluconolaconase n=1 Tax=Sandarakinorhabdus cyanobacteriorum TaxID=1981098 RepID=A0A255YB97_9SPHN|nr:SMP-30/gluconolactonase/LRE family protein [Sandarakinorhabdus cyanobacteriorum]OYQ26488.1 gluconolaconase [Sandarakinorhabdus cyanobacteriorum]
MTGFYPHEIVADGLGFPEGPVAMADGSVLVVEIRPGRITRIHPDGRKETVAEPGGGPNGMAVGPDGALYVCNNGGFDWYEQDGILLPGNAAKDYTTGRIERIDIATGAVTRLYDSCDGHKLSGPNDIVFDAHGGFYFTDLGKHFDHHTDAGGLFYALPDGSKITRLIHGPDLNGVGLSPDGRCVYAASTSRRVVLAFEIVAPGVLAPEALPAVPGRFVTTWANKTYLDSLAIEANGNIAQATLIENAGVTSIDPVTGAQEFFAFPDLLTTNICFGGDDMMDAWVCLSTTGKLAKCRWPRPGLKLNFNA